MYRVLPPFGGDQRATAEVVNGIMNGKTNNTGTVSLETGGALTTTITDERIGYDSKILLLPYSAAAYADSAPFGAFQDSTDQSAANTTTAYPVKFNITDYSNGETLSNSSRINVKNAGTYNFQFSIQIQNTTNDVQDFDIWFRKNGTNIADSNTRFGLSPRKSSGEPNHTIASMNFFIELAANDYVQLVWCTTDIGVTIEQYAVNTGPTRPTTPSAILTVQYVAPSSTANVYVSSLGKGTATITHFSNSTANKTYAYVIVG
jgi:hypothetical protein